jgi:4-hydroxy-3-polyprenylbenzoate decarboxylase
VDYDDLRGWIDRVRELGELRDVTGASRDEDIGAIVELLHATDDAPVALFDEIDDFPRGFRILANALSTRRRLALTLGLPLDIDRRSLMREFLRLTRADRTIPPELVETGPVLENVLTGDDIDVEIFPTPHWHEEDGGRYIGTGSAVVMRHPEEDWINVGTYRSMVHDGRRVGVHISPGKHGRVLRDAWWARGEPCPVAVICGPDPLLFLASTVEVPPGISEYDWVGAIRGEAYPVVSAPVTGLPVPAAAEIVLEGHLHPDRLLPEGPFGEWTGYYGSGVREDTYLEIEAILHRNDPILLGCPPNRHGWEPHRYREYLRSALLLRNLEGAGLVGVTDAQCHAVGGTRLFNVVSIDQRYAGHARQVLHAAASVHTGAYLGRVVVVVDDDIDVSDLDDVIWAIVTRADPERAIDIIPRAWSGGLDPAIHPDHKGHNSRLLIDATKPYEWRDRFPKAIGSDLETRERTRERWGHLLTGSDPV